MGRPSKSYTDREKKEGRVFQCLLWEEEFTPEELQCKLNRLNYYWEKYYYIKHDKDVYTEHDADKWNLEHGTDEPFPHEIGEVKKPHYHCIGVCSPALLGRAAIKFDLPSHRVQKVDKKKSAIRYLIHLDNPEKHQYLPEEIVTNDLDVESYLKQNQDSMSKAKILLGYIYQKNYVSFSMLTSFALENDCWDELRRGQHLFTSVLIEHNKEYVK